MTKDYKVALSTLVMHQLCDREREREACVVTAQVSDV